MSPPHDSPPTPLGSGLLAALILGVLGLAAFSNSFAGPFVFDDLKSIPGNPSLSHASSWFSPPHALGETVAGRPVLNASFGLTMAVYGTRVWGYHAGNLAIHLLAAVTLFGLLRRCLARAGIGRAWLLSLFVSALWVVHPLQTESVTYLVQRAESLMGLFYLATLYGFVRGLESRQWRLAWWALSVLACWLGMATKEVMVSAPVMVLALDTAFVAGSAAAALRERRGYYAALGLSWILLAVLVAGTHGRGGTSGLESVASPGAYWISQFPAVASYLRLALWPSPLVFDYGTQWVDSLAGVLFPALVVGAAAAATVYALIRSPRWGFLGLFFFAILAPTSLVPGGRQTMAEHRMYLALAPLLTAAVLGAHLGLRRRFPGSAMGILGGAVALAVLALGSATYQRNAVYASVTALDADTAAKAPANPYAQNNLGTDLLNAGQPASALVYFEKATTLKPAYPYAQANLGLTLNLLGRPREAVGHFTLALQLLPDYAKALTGLGAAYEALGQWPKAIAAFARASRLEPRNADLAMDWGNALVQAGTPREAIDQLERAHQLAPQDAGILDSLGTAYLMSERPDMAIAAYRAALSIDSRFALAHYDLGCALQKAGHWAEARGEFEDAVRLKPDFPQALQALQGY